MIKKTYVISDIHGCLEEFNNVLTQVNFNNEEDKLICLGDVCDRGSNVKGCIDRLMQIKNLVYITGNHDLWTLQFLTKKIDKYAEESWWKHGGEKTMQSFKGIDTTPYVEFLSQAKPYYIDEENRCFVHGGFDTNFPIESQSIESLVWDRELYEEARYVESCGFKDKISTYKEIYCGHTPTQYIDDKDIPLNFLNLWCIDTGVVYKGKLTIMDVNTKEFWQVNKL